MKDANSTRTIDLDKPPHKENLEDPAMGIPATMPDGGPATTVGVQRPALDGNGKEMLIAGVNGGTAWVEVPGTKQNEVQGDEVPTEQELRERYGTPILDPDPHNLGGKAVSMDKAGVEPLPFIDPSLAPASPLTKEILNYANRVPILSADPKQRVEAAKSIDGIGLSGLLLEAHSVIAPEEKPTANEEAGVMSDGNKLMSPDERFKFIEQTATLVNKVADRIDTENPQSIEAGLIRISNLVALATVITHTFKEGNGRTSRCLALLLRDGATGDEENIKLLNRLVLNRNGGEKVIYGFIPRTEASTQREKWDKTMEFAASLDTPLTRKGQNQYYSQTWDYFSSPFNDTLE